MKIGGIDLSHEPFVIAEIGANHEGDLGAARTMIEEAAKAGAHAVKFQTYKAEKIVARTETARFAHFQKLALDDSAWSMLAEHARAHGVFFMSTPFDVDAVDVLDPLVPAFKVASGDLTFLPLLERIARTGKPIVLSTGMGTLDEIAIALDTIQRAGRLDRAELVERVVLLHCVASYPAQPHDANLLAMRQMRERFGVPVGYSDHTLGIVACLAAAALGAQVLEKHFTLQKEGRTFRDHQLSADPADLKALMTGLRELTQMLGTGDKAPVAAEEANRVSMRRSLAVRRDIKAGTMIAADDLICLRPGSGIPPSKLGDVVGCVARADIPAGHLLEAAALGPRRA